MPFQTLETATTSKRTFITARSQMLKSLERMTVILDEVTRAHEICKKYDGKRLGKKTREKIENDFYNAGLGCFFANVDDAFVWYVRTDIHVRKFGSGYNWELAIFKDMNEASPKMDTVKMYADNLGYFKNYKDEIAEIEKKLTTDTPEKLDNLYRELETTRAKIDKLHDYLGISYKISAI